MSQFFTSGGQSIGAWASVLPMNIQDWFLLGLTGLISLHSKGLSRVFSNATVLIVWVYFQFAADQRWPQTFWAPPTKNWANPLKTGGFGIAASTRVGQKWHCQFGASGWHFNFHIFWNTRSGISWSSRKKSRMMLLLLLLLLSCFSPVQLCATP